MPLEKPAEKEPEAEFRFPAKKLRLAKPPGLDRAQRSALLDAVDARDWEAAVVEMERPKFLPMDMCRKICRAKDEFEWWLDEDFFARCKDEGLIRRAMGRLVEAHGATGKKSDPIPERLAMSLFAEWSPVALDCALAAQPGFFTEKNQERAATAIMHCQKWRCDSRAPELRAQINGLERWFPEFKAAVFLKKFADVSHLRPRLWPRRWPPRVNPKKERAAGLGAVARLAVEEGLPLSPPPEHAGVARSGDSFLARTALEMALREFETPDVFMAFIRAGANPADRFVCVSTAGFDGSMEWDAPFGLEPRQLAWPKEWRAEGFDRRSLSIQEVLEGALRSEIVSVPFGRGMEEVRDRIDGWRAAWEQWILSKETGLGGGVNVGERKSDDEAAREERNLAEKSSPKAKGLRI